MFSTFVGSESGQIQSVKLLQNIVSKQGLNAPHPLPATHRKYILYFWHREGGRAGLVEPERRWEVQRSQSWVENINITDCISSL